MLSRTYFEKSYTLPREHAAEIISTYLPSTYTYISNYIGRVQTVTNMSQTGSFRDAESCHLRRRYTVVPAVRYKLAGRQHTTLTAIDILILDRKLRVDYEIEIALACMLSE